MSKTSKYFCLCWKTRCRCLLRFLKINNSDAARRTYFIAPPSFEVISSLLRVSTVLKFPKFREFAVHSLTSAWSVELESFSKDSKWLEYAAETVTLARECDVTYVLKRALYELVRTPGFTKVQRLQH
jgi:hypothetical protein